MNPIRGSLAAHSSLRFTPLHELSHLAKRFEILSSTDHVFFDEPDIETDDKTEAEADSLAGNGPVPLKFAKVCKKEFAPTEQSEEASEEAGVHVSIVAGRRGGRLDERTGRPDRPAKSIDTDRSISNPTGLEML